MAQVKITNHHYSPLKKENVGKESWEDCEIIRLNKSTAVVFVPRINKTITVKRWKIQENTKPMQNSKKS